jgi:thymidylate synthase
MNPEMQYLEIMEMILEFGHKTTNKRTGKGISQVISADISYEASPDKAPILTTKKMFYKAAIAELLGYLRGYTSAADFRAIGTKTWDMNANDNEAWLSNPNRIGTDDMGKVYGYQMRNFGGSGHDQLTKVYNNLKAGIDDRGEILSMWNPSQFDEGCLRPCMYEHQFSLTGNTLYLNSTQRSGDWCLGVPFNMIQCYVLLMIMARITGHEMGCINHRIVNAHIYEDHYEGAELQLSRKEYHQPKLTLVNPNINTLDDVLNHLTVDDFELTDYFHHGKISFPFSV